MGKTVAEVEDTPENVQVCKRFCGTCPSYPKVEGEWLYCARGGSKASVERKSCKCPDCEVWVKCGLSRTYYCDQRK